MRKLVDRALLAAVLAGGPAGQALAEAWDVSLWGERRASTEHVHKLAELVEERTGGEFTLNIDYGGLSNPRETLDGISIGAFEMAQFCAGYHADKNPTLTVLELPFLGTATLEEEVVVSRAVYAHPAVAEDLGRWKARLLMPSPTPQHNLVGKGEPRNSIEALAGMRVRAAGGLGKALEAAGAVPNPVPATEAYAAMESGVVDTVAFAPDAHLSFRTIELADWWTENLNAGTLHCPIVVNSDAYQALSPEHREALDGSLDEALAAYLEGYDELLGEWSDILKANDVERIRFPEQEVASFREVAGPVRDQWLKDMEAQGLPGQELYALVQRTLEEHRASD